MTIYTYRRKNLETGESLVVRMGFSSRLLFLEALNRWNASARWKYWEVAE
jgi:hypothetical protein